MRMLAFTFLPIFSRRFTPSELDLGIVDLFSFYDFVFYSYIGFVLQRLHNVVPSAMAKISSAIYISIILL